MNEYLSPRKLAERARRVLDSNPMTSEEHWEFLIARGIIDRNGRVLVGGLFSEDTSRQEPAAPGVPPAATSNGEAGPAPLLPRDQADSLPAAEAPVP